MNHAPRILLVSYHFGPTAATGGFRWTRLVPLLVARGWSFDVITHDPPSEHPNGGVTVHSVTTPRWAERAAWVPEGLPNAIWATMRGRRRNARQTVGAAAEPAAAMRPSPLTDPSRVVVPEHGVTPPLRQQFARALVGLAEETRHFGWAAAAASVGIALTRRHRYDAVIVSSPPHLSHWAGLRIHWKSGVPFIPDFRDPWVLGIGESTRNANVVYRALGHVLEPRINHESAAIVHNTDIERRIIGALIPKESRLHRAIPNGHDLTRPPGFPHATRFIIAYTGHLHGWMDPRPFFQSCQRVFAAHSAIGATAEIHFMGVPPQFGGVDIRGLAAAYGLDAQFRYRPRGTREEANALQESAAVLLAYDCTHRLCIPAKFFDYAYMRGVMLLLGHPDGAMAEAAAPIGARVISPSDAAGIDHALVEAYVRWRDGDLKEQNDRAGIYARPRQAELWNELLLEVSGRAAP